MSRVVSRLTNPSRTVAIDWSSTEAEDNGQGRAWEGGGGADTGFPLGNGTSGADKPPESRRHVPVEVLRLRERIEDGSNTQEGCLKRRPLGPDRIPREGDINTRNS